ALRGTGSNLKALVTLYAPMDLEQVAGALELIPESLRRAAMGTPLDGMLLARMRDLSPLRHVGPGMPPFLLIHGTADTMVPFEQSRTMCQAVRQAGGECDLLAVKGGGHGLRRWEAAGLTSYKRLMVEWLKKRVSR